MLKGFEKRFLGEIENELEDVIASLGNDERKIIPKDGTVHELTSNVSYIHLIING